MAFRDAFTMFLLAVLGFASHAYAADGDAAKSAPPLTTHPDAALLSAEVEVDGIALFRVLGVPAFPAAERAGSIAERIEALAADPSFSPENVRVVESDVGSDLTAGGKRLMTVTDSDAKLEGIGRKAIAEVYATRIREAIEAWRAARTREALERSALHALGATVVLILCLVLMRVVWRRAHAALERRYRQWVHSVGIQSFQILRAERIWDVVDRVVGAAGMLLALALVFIYLHYVLRLFPWTYGAGTKLMSYALAPLKVLGGGLLAQMPNLIFLAILFVLTRWTLKLVHLFFGSIGRGEVTFGGFEAEWAEPTYKIVRLLVIMFALIVAYPYIPGSSSDAFKGISLFVGVVFSLGSSSIIANMMAGYMMTYRRAFRVGDRVKIGDVVGDVSEMRLQVTHVRTVKNEEVIIPNSKILNDEVVNYSTLAHTEGLILYTTVGIGYETPWRQVEAMLLEAARQTPGLMTENGAFVRQKSLGDFAVTYELNVYTSNAQAMSPLYTELHHNILDVFNEHGVQIMTPAYEGDTPEPKVVPKDKWFLAPAAPPKG